MQVHARVDTIAVGKLSLNLTCLNKESTSVFGSRLRLAIEDLLPFTHYLPLTIEHLNTVSLSPKKDYNTNRLLQILVSQPRNYSLYLHHPFYRLVSGVLQLAEGSHLTMDETELQAGTLNSTGVENARVLKSLMESQKVHFIKAIRGKHYFVYNGTGAPSGHLYDYSLFSKIRIKKCSKILLGYNLEKMLFIFWCLMDWNSGDLMSVIHKQACC